MASMFTPNQVSLNSGGSTPYLFQSGNLGTKPSTGDMWNWGGNMSANGSPAQLAVNNQPQPPQSNPNTQSSLLPEAVRDTGSGPFDQAFRQNLATYAGGQFARPQQRDMWGNNIGSPFLGFDVTGKNLPGGPTGGGSAPVMGMPNSLLSMAMGGQPFSFTPPTQASSDTGTNSGGSDTSAQDLLTSISNWLQQFSSGSGGAQPLFSPLGA